jgi:hypothetical protein
MAGAAVISTRLAEVLTRALLFALSFSAAFAASAAADPAVTGAAAAMRQAPSATARIVQRVPANAEIDLSQCSGAWCYASWRNRFGDLPAAAIAKPPYPPAAAPADGPYRAWSGAAVGPFSYGYGWYRW